MRGNTFTLKMVHKINCSLTLQLIIWQTAYGFRAQPVFLNNVLLSEFFFTFMNLTKHRTKYFLHTHGKKNYVNQKICKKFILLRAYVKVKIFFFSPNEKKFYIT